MILGRMKDCEKRFVALGHRLFVISKTEWKLFEEKGSIQIPGLRLAAL